MSVLFVALGGSNATSDLYTLDPATGAMSAIGPIGFALTGLAFDPTTGLLYGSTSNNSGANPGSLITVDTSTGAGSLLGSFGVSGSTAADIAFDATGQLYGWKSVGGGLWSINKSTGAATLIHATSDFSGGLDFDGSGTLWHIGGALHKASTIDTSTGIQTPGATLAPALQFRSGKFDGSNVFWAVDAGDNLNTVDQFTGVVTFVSSPAVGGVDALAWGVAGPSVPSLSKTATTPTAPSATCVVTLTAHNPTGSPVTVTQFTDTLPAGFSYFTGTTTGATTANPTIVGSVLTWNGSWNVVAGGTLALTFHIRASATPGTYTNASSATVTGTGIVHSSATIHVTGAIITLSPSQAVVGTTISLTGSLFAPSSAVHATFNGAPLTVSSGATNGAGNYSGTFVVPALAAGTYAVTLTDASSNVGLAAFKICVAATYDTPDLTVDPPMLGYPATATWTTVDPPFDYVHHDGHHFEVERWHDPGTFGAHDTFPPPAGSYHALRVRRVDDAGTTLNEYLLDLDWYYSFHGSLDSYLFCQEFGTTVSFVDWDMKAIDARFASDGTDLWLAVLGRECVPFPYLSTLDGTTPPGCSPGGYPSMAAQFQPLATLEATYANFSRFVHAPSVLPSAGTSPPDSAGGSGFSGHYSPVRLIVFHFNGTGFDRLDTVDAKYNMGPDGRMDNGLSAACVAGGLSAAASPVEPGVCHVVWADGGYEGVAGYGTGYTGGPPVVYQTWDTGMPNLGYRINYSRWSSSAKTLDTDLADTLFDRTSWFSLDGDGFPHDKVYPSSADLTTTNLMALKNDHGSPVLFLAWMLTKNVVDPDSGFDYYVPDRAEPTMRMWDISSGSGVEIQVLDPLLLPTAAEAANQVPAPPAPAAPTRLQYQWNANSPFRSQAGFAGTSLYSDQAQGFAIAPKYRDAKLGARDVYLLHVAWTAPRLGFGFNDLNSRGLYRVPCDGSLPFSLLDGNRDIAVFPTLTYTVGASSVVPSLCDFISEPRNVWVAGNGAGFFAGFRSLIYLDRSKCGPAWRRDYLGGDGFSKTLGNVQSAAPFYDSVTNRLYYIGEYTVASAVSGVAFTTICRDCANCGCARGGLHIWARI